MNIFDLIDEIVFLARNGRQRITQLEQEVKSLKQQLAVALSDDDTDKAQIADLKEKLSAVDITALQQKLTEVVTELKNEAPTPDTIPPVLQS